jgi:hypothetical protein
MRAMTGNQIKSDRESCLDPFTKQETAFFNPRIQVWKDHFEWSADKTILIGLTPEGQATVSCLQLNTEMLQEARKIWKLFGWPPA